MFTGIVVETGTVAELAPTEGGRRLRLRADVVMDGLALGDSVAVNGVCLTVTGLGDDAFAVEAVPETLARSNLGDLAVGSLANLERPLRADGRFDGHIVQGHVDAVGTIVGIEAEGDSRRLRVEADTDLLRYVVEKGSITVDGVSLTVTAADADAFEFVLIPHTLDVTVFGQRQVGDRVNLEVDVLAKYVERILEART